MPTLNRRSARRRNDADDDEKSRPRVRQRSHQLHQPPVERVSAALLPPSAPQISAEQKAECRRIVEEIAQRLLQLRMSNISRTEKYAKRKAIIVETNQLYGAWLGENTLKNRADYLWKIQSKSEAESVDVDVLSDVTNNKGARASTTAFTRMSTVESDKLPTNTSNASTTSSTTESSTTHSINAFTTTPHSNADPDSSQDTPSSTSTLKKSHPNACSFDKCACKNRPPKFCSEEGCTMTVHKLCQLNYRNDQGIEDEDDVTFPLRCERHEMMLLPQHSALSSSTACENEATSTCVPSASADNSSSTTSSTVSESTPNVDMTVGCDWRDVVDGGCLHPDMPIEGVCGVCKKKTHHLCHLNYEEKCISGGEQLQVRCSDCFHPGVVRHGSPASPYVSSTSPSQQSSETSSCEISSSESDPTISHPLRKKGGRPKGVTKKGQEERDKKIALMTDYLAAKVKAAQDESKDGKLRKGTYSVLHQKAQDHFDLQDVSIHYDTIKHRIQRGNITVTAMGPKSPLAVIEPFLVEIVKQAQEAGQPVTPSHFVEIANSLLEESVVKEALREYNKARNLNPDTKVSKNYYNGFMKRNELRSSKGTRKSTMRMDDMTEDNVKTMYELVYQRMVDAGVAVNLPEEEHYYIDIDGNVTTDDTKKFGEKCTQKILHPDYCLYADEVGSDMCQEEDGAIGGERYITDNGVAYIRGCKTSHRFTVFAITAGNGEVVMYVVIFAAKEMSFITRMGLDLENVSKYDPDKPLDEQVGEDMPFPGAPKTTFRGVEMEAFITCNESGSMTGEILAQILQRIDDAGVFARTEDGPRPMFLLDGHGSRLTLAVLRYANKKDRWGRPMWYLTIGLPNGTELWQLGDQSEQNGKYKMDLTRFKQRLLLLRQRLRLTQVLTRSDIVPILHRVLPASFGRRDSNIRALTRLGWYHLNRALLFDPRVLQRAVSSASANVSDSQSFASIDHMRLNVSNGVAGTTCLDYNQQLERNMALKQARAERRRESEQAAGSLEHIKGRLTAGRLFSSGTVALDSEVLAVVERSAQAKVDKLYERLRKKAVAFDAASDEYRKLLRSGKAESAYNCDNLKAFIKVRRLKEHKSVPSKKDDLVQMKRLLATCEPLDLKGHLKSHTTCTDEQIDDFLTRYNADVDDESGDDEEEECDEIGQTEEV